MTDTVNPIPAGPDVTPETAAGLNRIGAPAEVGAAPSPTATDNLPLQSAGTRPGSFGEKLSMALLAPKPAGATVHSPMAEMATAGIKALAPGWDAVLGKHEATAPTVPVQPEKRSFSDRLMARLGDSSAAPGPGGMLGGFVRTAKAGAERTAEETKARITMAQANAQMIHEQALLHKMGQDELQSGIVSGKEGLAALEDAGGSEVVRDQDSVWLHQQIEAHNAALKAGDPNADNVGLDPNKSGVFLTGQRQIGTDPTTGQPRWRSTYTVVKPPADVTFKNDDPEAQKKLAYINSQLHLGLKTSENSPLTMSGQQFYNTWQRAQNVQAQEMKRDQDFKKAGLDATKLDESVGFRAMASDWNRIMGQNDNDSHAALAAMQKDPAMSKKYPNMTDDVIEGGYGGLKNWDTVGKQQAAQAETARHNLEEEATKKQDEKDKKDATRKYLGDDKLTGDAFLNSIPDAGDRAVVKEMGNGQMNINRMELLMRSGAGPNLLNAVALAYPKFDKSKVDAYVKEAQEYASTRKNVAGGQLVAGDVAFQHLAELKDINDRMSIRERMAGRTSKLGAAFEDKLDTLTGELITFYGLPSTNEQIQNLKDNLGGKLTSRDSAITTQAQSMSDRFNEIESHWTQDLAPSAEYARQMPNKQSSNGLKARATLDPRFAAQTTGQKLPAPPPPPPNSLGTFDVKVLRKNNPTATDAQLHAVIEEHRTKGYTIVNEK